MEQVKNHRVNKKKMSIFMIRGCRSIFILIMNWEFSMNNFKEHLNSKWMTEKQLWDKFYFWRCVIRLLLIRRQENTIHLLQMNWLLSMQQNNLAMNSKKEMETTTLWLKIIRIINRIFISCWTYVNLLHPEKEWV